jgi:hypothetical protein
MNFVNNSAHTEQLQVCWSTICRPDRLNFYRCVAGNGFGSGQSIVKSFPSSGVFCTDTNDNGVHKFIGPGQPNITYCAFKSG